MENILKEAKTLLPQMRKDRRFLHKNAEVGFELPETSKYIIERLKKLGYAPKVMGRYAIIAEIGAKKGACFLLRADMDALPMQEKSGEAFACKSGNMHACGHDLHTSMLLGAAALLKSHEDSLRGKVRLLFQPAEERLEGAKFCIEAGCLDGVGGAAMLHVLPLPNFEAGSAIVSSAGVSAPAADFFEINVYGKGCHGSSPWQGVDALLIAAKIVDALQVILSREFSPQVPIALTIGKLESGTSENVLAKEAKLSGTLRAMSEEVRERVKERLSEIVKWTAKAFRGRTKIVYKSGCPCLMNDERLSSMMLDVSRRALGQARSYSSSDFPKGGVGGSEDFAYISQKVPAIMVGLAAGLEGADGMQPLHSDTICFDERAMPYGAALLASAAMDYLAQHAKR